MNKWDHFYMQIAYDAAMLSSCKRKQVGAVLVKEGRIISFGYNGTLPGDDNNCEDYLTGKTKPGVAHAEQNAIYKVAASNESSQNSTLYITCAPCIECSKIIIRSGIKKIIYGEIYKNHNHSGLLERHNVEFIKYKALE